MNQDASRPPLLSDAELAAMTEAERAEYYYANRDRLDEIFTGPEVAVNATPDAASVVSVRFPAGQIGVVEAAAKAAGIPVSTFIRLAALGAAERDDAIGSRVREELAAAFRALEGDLERAKRLAGAA